MTKNSTERLGGKYDLESRRSAFSCTPEQESTHQLPKHLQIWYYAGFKEVLFLRITFTAVIALQYLAFFLMFSRESCFCYLDESSGIRE